MSNGLNSQGWFETSNLHFTSLCSYCAGLTLPATALPLFIKLGSQIAFNNSRLAPAFLKECCLAFALPLGASEENLLLSFLESWLHELAGPGPSCGKVTEPSGRLEVARDLIASSLASSWPLHPGRLAVWSQAAKVESILEPLAQELISRAMQGEDEAQEVISEVMPFVFIFIFIYRLWFEVASSYNL